MVAYWVYLLSDPETHRARYVGLTQNPAGRAMWHKCRPRKCNMPRLRGWFEELHKKGIRPDFKELACISGEDENIVAQTAKACERFWIRNHASIEHQALLNIDSTDAGQTEDLAVTTSKVSAFLSTVQVAERMGLTRRRIQKLCEQGRLGRRVGGRYVISGDEVGQFVAARE